MKYHIKRAWVGGVCDIYCDRIKDEGFGYITARTDSVGCIYNYPITMLINDIVSITIIE